MSSLVSNRESLPPELVLEERGPVRILTLNDPGARNAINDAMHIGLCHFWENIADDPAVGAIVLTGAGGGFSAGGSMHNIKAMHADPVERRRSIRDAERLFRSMMSCEVPIVAAVNGPAVGLGATLALLCDLAVMSSETFICDPHVSIGVVAGDGGAVIWPLCMSLQRAKEFLLLGDRVSAADCERLGLVNRVAPPGDVLPDAIALAERLAGQPRQAVRDTKRALNMHLRQSADLVLDFALAAEGESFASDDVLATIRRFIKD